MSASRDPMHTLIKWSLYAPTLFAVLGWIAVVDHATNPTGHIAYKLIIITLWAVMHYFVIRSTLASAINTAKTFDKMREVNILSEKIIDASKQHDLGMITDEEYERVVAATRSAMREIYGGPSCSGCGACRGG